MYIYLLFFFLKWNILTNVNYFSFSSTSALAVTVFFLNTKSNKNLHPRQPIIRSSDVDQSLKANPI